MTSITAGVGRIKDHLEQWITTELVERACKAAGHAWRDRLLGPVTTLRLLVLQVLHGNAACRTTLRLAGLACSDAAYCQARARLPLEAIGMIAASLTHEARQAVRDFGRWRGRRVFHIDGSGLSMPDEPELRQRFGVPNERVIGCGFPMMHVLWLFDAATGLIADFAVERWNRHDLADASKLHAPMAAGDVLVGDRAFGSYAHLALLLRRNLHGLFREHQRRKTPRPRKPRKHGQRRRIAAQLPGAGASSRVIRSLGPGDDLLEYDKPAKAPSWMTPEEFDQLPGAITVRRITYRVTSPGCRTRHVTLVTTLTDPRKYSRDDLMALYESRWRIETNLRHLKQTLKLHTLRCTTLDGVMKELWAYLIVYNQVRLLMLESARRQRVACHRISFIDTLDALRCGPLWPTLQATLDLLINPRRPGRHEPRVIKRRKDKYSYMTQPRAKLRQSLLRASSAVTC